MNSLNLLERRLQTIVAKKNIAKTIKEARQMIIHKRIIVDKNVINIPSYLVPKDVESKIRIKTKKPRAPKEPSEQQETK